MEKLIELLNEYEEEWKEKNGMLWCKWEILNGMPVARSEYSDEILDNSDLLLISAKHGFIKRLVEKNKIDTQNLITYMKGTSLTFNKVPSTDGVNIDKMWNKFYTETLLMLLAIQDEPINFLISILK